MAKHDDTSEAKPPPTLSGRLERLFDVHRPPDRPEKLWTNREVVTACKEAGYELSESHLSELRRGLKQNPTVRTLAAVSWFFGVPVGYFTDPDTASQVEQELAEREAALEAKLAANRQAQDELRSATEELQQAMRESGVTRMAHRGIASATAAREQASMMRALARALVEDEDDEDDEEADAGKADT